MALKKPSDFFNEKSTFEEVQEQLEPEKIESLTEAFQVFKTNLNNIQTLSDFSSALSGFKENFEKVDLLSKEIEVLKESVVDSFSKKRYQSAKYQIQVESNNMYQTTEILIVHDNITTYVTEYGTINTQGSLASFTADLSGNNIRLLATPLSSDLMKFKLIRKAINA